MQSSRLKPSESLAFPKVKISSRGAKRIEDGHMWVYRSDILADEGVDRGAVAQAFDERGKLLGTAFYSTASQIAIRMISRDVVKDLNALLRERVRGAIAYRERFVSDTDAYRVVFSEGDFLPGLIVDRYNDLLSFQVLTQATDAEIVRESVLGELSAQLHPAAIGERVEPKIRELEQLPPRSSGLVQGDKASTIFSMNGLRFHYDVKEGQKTGAFLDQRENYAAAAKYARGEALDVFCYHGGFALHLAQAGCKVSGLDSSRPALEVADRNAVLNGREIEWIEGNAFDVLRDYSKSGHRYDAIVLDPPAFAKSKRDLDTALRGYKELNLRALKMLRQGGILVTCSCSYHVSAAEFLAVVAEAARDAHRELRVLESRGQAKDHPVLTSVPETGYLKCLVFHVSG
jgi:23S rRNA (cytosine1962-C5)-methyltransferase